MLQNYAARILALEAERLEEFVRDWLSYRVQHYIENERWSGSGDMGRDVVGYVTKNRHEGDWDNFQCKQLKARLSEKGAFLELGKIFMHAAAGEFTLPRAYYFVAPKGVVRNVQTYIAHPEKFRAACLSNWPAFCENDLVENKPVPLTPEISTMIGSFNFKEVYAIDASKLANDQFIKPVLVEWFGHDPGEAPHGSAPDSPQFEEAVYLRQLADVYGEQTGTMFASTDEVLADPNWGKHLRIQRERYFDAAEFKRYYRDSTPGKYLDIFQEDIYHGVFEVYADEYKDKFDRVKKVLTQAANIQASGVLAKYARVPVKQGICHHFANEGRLSW